ncbi:MAG: hypothetical protein HW389_3681, partial [Bacteroidetes bacterium]|nr:hypothetical protein [Bacteroidota bacterium]
RSKISGEYNHIAILQCASKRLTESDGLFTGVRNK